MEHQIYSIKQAAKITGLPVSTLRYYEKMGLIQKIERNASRYRAYSEKDIMIISVIVCLHATGMSIEDMKSYLAGVIEEDISHVRQLESLKNQEKILLKQQKELTLRKKYIRGKMKYWELIYTGDEETFKKLNLELAEMAKKLKEL